MSKENQLSFMLLINCNLEFTLHDVDETSLIIFLIIIFIKNHFVKETRYCYKPLDLSQKSRNTIFIIFIA